MGFFVFKPDDYSYAYIVFLYTQLIKNSMKNQMYGENLFDELDVFRNHLINSNIFLGHRNSIQT